MPDKPQKPNGAQDPFAALERTFHEPSRLAIISALIPAVDGLSFSELKATCNLTDGNLSRHLSVLEERGIVGIAKDFNDRKPLTTARMTEDGRQQFMTYLQALEQVLKQANKRMKKATAAGITKPARSRRRPAGA